MKTYITLMFGLFLLYSCAESRIMDPQELVLSESVYEENGFYYKHAVNHKKIKHTGKCLFYWHSNGNKKGIAILENGLPHGHWEYWNEDSSKRLNLYFEKGKLIKKE